MGRDWVVFKLAFFRQIVFSGVEAFGWSGLQLECPLLRRRPLPLVGRQGTQAHHPGRVAQSDWESEESARGSGRDGWLG